MSYENEQELEISTKTCNISFYCLVTFTIIPGIVTIVGFLNS